MMRIILACLALMASATALHAQEAVGVLSAPVTKQEFFERIEALGTLRANESVELTANVTETITAIRFEDNQRVTKGAVLAEMTSAEEQALLEEAISTLNEAKKQFERVRVLTGQGNAPKALLDQRKREKETAQARLTAIQSRLKDRLIIAPFDGVVGLRTISVGALVTPGDVVTTVDDDTRMKLDFSVPATYLDDVKVGLPVRATARAYGAKPFEGEITSIDSRIDPVSRAFQVRALLPNPEFLLKPGLLMQVNILANQRETLVIPEEALVPEGRKQFVMRVQEQDGTTKAVKTEVTIGGRRPGEVEILDGLSEGDEVVTEGTLKIRDGSAIRVKASAF